MVSCWSNGINDHENRVYVAQGSACLARSGPGFKLHYTKKRGKKQSRKVPIPTHLAMCLKNVKMGNNDEIATTAKSKFMLRTLVFAVQVLYFTIF